MSIGQWNHKDTTTPARYGDEPTYVKAAVFLDQPGWVVEDRGCGTAYAKRFFTKSTYVGVDGSWSKFCDVEADLRTYRSSPDGILMRHVLEHDYDWSMILEGAVASFKKRMALVFFMPLTEFTKVESVEANGTPNLMISRVGVSKILTGLSITEEVVKDLAFTWPYHEERIFYIEKAGSP